MVERPIKKSERQARTESNDAGEGVEASQSSSVAGSPAAPRQAPKPKGSSQPARDKDKSRRKGDSSEEARPGAMNPALMRGPKPTQPKPPVAPVTPAEDEAIAEESAPEATEAASEE
jgi:hypothetical protein